MAETETAPASETPATVAPVSFEALIEGWWNDHFPGSPIAQVTNAWNFAFAAKEDLKRRLQEVI